MIELGSIVRVVGRCDLAVVTGESDDGWLLLETVEDGVYLGAYLETELEVVE